MTLCPINAIIIMGSHMLKAIITAPGRWVVKRFPNLGEDETRLLHNMANYIVWLGIFVGGLIALIIKYPPI